MRRRMDAFSWAALALLVVCLVLIAFVAAAEAGLISISRVRVRLMAGRGIPRAEILQSYVQERASLLRALALARNLAIIAAAALAMTILTRERGHGWGWVGVVVIIALASIVIVEAVPRVIVTRDPERWGLRLAPFMGAFKFLFGVPARILDLPVRAVTRNPPRMTEEEEEMLRLMELEEDEGDLEESERKMIRGVFGLEETTGVLRPGVQARRRPADGHAEAARACGDSGGRVWRNGRARDHRGHAGGDRWRDRERVRPRRGADRPRLGDGSGARRPGQHRRAE